MSGDTTIFVRQCLDRMQAGDNSARDELIAVVAGRLQKLARRMLDDYSRLRQFEETDDVLSSAVLRLTKALKSVTPESPKHFYRLAALQIRRELKELARRHFHNRRPTVRPASDAGRPGDDTAYSSAADPSDVTHEPGRLAQWAELHERVGQLPEPEREVFEIIWYNQLTQGEAAKIIGISRRTVIRRWQAACLRLYDDFHGELPGQK